MVRELKLTDKQKTKLKVILKVHKDKADAWTKENGEKLKGLRNERQEARKAGNKEKTRTLNKQLKPLEDARKKLELEKMAAVTVILTPEQKKAWKAYQFHSGVVRRYRRMRLKDEQKKQIRELCAAAQKEIEALGDKKKGRKKIVDDLNKKIVAEVLTEEQRAQRKRVRTRGQRGGDRPRAAGQERPRKQ